MSTLESATVADDDETQLVFEEGGEEETPGEESGNKEMEVEEEQVVEDEPAAPKKKRKEPVELESEPGKSLFPFSRVQKIIKADKEIPIVAREATFLISLAAEEFIKRIVEAGHRLAERERRSTVQHKDIVTVVRKTDEFLFLEEIMPWTSTEPPAKRTKLKAGANDKGVKHSGPTLDHFVVNKRGDGGDDDDGEDIVMNEDGTMVAAGSPADNNDDD